jgi:hypothetical protein
MDIPQAKAAVGRAGCMACEEAVGRIGCMAREEAIDHIAREEAIDHIVRFVREAEHVGAGSMDRLEGAVESCTVDLEARLGRTVLVELNGAARRWTERGDKQRIRTEKRKASVLPSTHAPDR